MSHLTRAGLLLGLFVGASLAMRAGSIGVPGNRSRPPAQTPDQTAAGAALARVEASHGEDVR